MKYYFDTCIWRDYFENRRDRFRPLGDWATELISKIIAENGFILLSDAVYRELKKDYSEKDIEEKLDFINEKILLRIKSRPEQFRRAIEISNHFKVPVCDAIHIVLARDNSAILVSRDGHLLGVKNIFHIMKPEDLI